MRPGDKTFRNPQEGIIQAAKRVKWFGPDRFGFVGVNGPTFDRVITYITEASE